MVYKKAFQVGCLTPACQPHVFWWLPLDVNTGGGEGGLGPRVNKFEQLSSDDHQMSVAVGGVPQV